jgi:hypothetical protein
MKLVLIKLLTRLAELFKNLNWFINKYVNYMQNDLKFKILAIEHNKSGRFLSFHLNNEYLFDKVEALQAIFNTLMSNDKFLEFGSKKIIITTALINGTEFNFHHNVLINNNTSFMEYYYKVKDIVQENYVDGYPIDVIPIFHVRVWNMDNINNINIKGNIKNNQKRYYHTNAKNKNKKINYINYITPLENKISRQLKSLSTMDIETIDYNGKQIPIAISTAYAVNKSKLFLINRDLLLIDHDKAINNLWKEYLNFILDNSEYFKNIFVHNLGSFDGYLLYPGLSEILLPNEISCIFDNQNKFIQIKINKNNTTITWKDSYRVFPVSLDNLSKVFNVIGKSSKYDINFNNLNLFDNTDLLNSFKTYSLQDSICLLNALNKAQEIYSNDNDIDISDVLSTSCLSLKIFRKDFLKHNIPILKNWQDNFIRKSYLGGSTDYYKAFVKKLYYYDINSLYPTAMKFPMPHEIIKEYKDMSNIKLENVFGFFLAEIECPKDIIRPLLAHRYKGETIHPTAKWIDVYFSEELKIVSKYGYKITLIRGYEFSKIDLFSDYVNHFYDKKKNAKSPSEKLIAKMHLNQLYGIFGRKQELIESKNVFNKDLYKYLSTRIIKTIITINDEISTLLLIKNINYNIIKEINQELDLNIDKNFNMLVKSNVAIATAITSYSRILMILYNLDDCIVYTDTDSIFTNKKLNFNEIGDSLGLMKDELKGNIIEEAYFLGIKQYGYYYYDKNNNNNKVEKSVFAGVTRDSLKIKEIEEIFNGKTIEKFVDVRFYKSFCNLDISIKSSKITIKMNNKKKLINNNYIPLFINDCKHDFDNRDFITKLINKFKMIINKFLLKYINKN